MVFFNHTRVSPTLAPRKTPNTGPWLTTNLKRLQNLAVKRTHLSRLQNLKGLQSYGGSPSTMREAETPPVVKVVLSQASYSIEA